jgi:hypothetical protein
MNEDNLNQNNLQSSQEEQKEPFFTPQSEATEDKSFDPAKGETQDRQKPKEVDIERYKDIEGLTLRKLNLGLWYVEHKRFLRMILIGFLIVISAVSWSYTIYGFAYYFTRGMDEDELLARQLVGTGAIDHNAVLSSGPKDLVYGQAKILKSTDKRYDFFVQIKNPNERHGAEFEYYFLTEGKEVGRSSGFILPSESKYLLALSEEFSTKPVSAQLKFANFSWQRIDRHKISDWTSYRDNRLDIDINDAKFTPAKLSGLSEKVSLNQLEFRATNKTAYNYWNVDFVILLYSGLNVVGVNKYGLEEFMSGQDRQVSISWPGNIGRVNKVEIIPEVNILKDNIYIKYEGGIGEEK